MQYMDKTNGSHFNHLKKNELVVSSFPFPQGNEISIPIMANWIKMNGEKGAGARNKG